MIASIIKVTWLPWAQRCAAFTLFERSYGSWHIVLFTLRFLLHDKQAVILLEVITVCHCQQQLPLVYSSLSNKFFAITSP